MLLSAPPTTSAATAISVRGLRVSYGDVEAVRGVDLDVRTGEILALLGPNGAGKTSTVEVLEGFRVATAGAVSVLGADPRRAPRAWRERLGIVLQESAPELGLSVRECLRLYAGYYTAPRAVEETLALVGLEDRGDHEAAKLSGGQRRRLDVALALIGDPELIFLDEPTTGFDPAARRQAWEVVGGLRALGRTIVLTTHYMEEAERLADRIVVMARGEVVADGTPATLGGRDRAAAIVTFSLPGGADGPPRGAEVDARGRVTLRTERPMAELHELTGWALARDLELTDLEVRRPTLEDVYLELTPMTQILLLHQLRFDLLSIRRNRRAQFFILALPVLLLVTFAGLFGTDAVEVAGQDVAANRASVPGIMGLAVLTSSFMSLVMSVVSQREAGILKRRRATPVPAAVLVVSRALTATISSVAACALLVAVASLGFGIDPPPGGLGPALLAVLAGSLCFAACGYAIAASVTSADSAQPLMQAILLPLQMISGIYFPTSALPGWLAHVADAFPLVHLTNALQHAWLPSGASVSWGDLGVMALWTAGAAYVAARRFRWLPHG